MTSKFIKRHRDVSIFQNEVGFYWEDDNYGAESEEFFSTLEAACSDIESWFNPAHVNIDAYTY